MSLRILHVLDHSTPLHSGYTFRTLSILREQRRLGWQAFHLTSPKQAHCAVPEETFDVPAYPRHSMRLTELVTPLKPLEAMAQGRLVVASDVGGYRELITHGETGLLFEAGSAAALADKLAQLPADRPSWPALRSAGRRLVERERNWRDSVGRYGPVLRQLLERDRYASA